MRRAAGIAAIKAAVLLKHSKSSSSGMLSATMPAPIMNLVKQHFNNPVTVKVTKLDGNVVTAYYDSYTANWNVLYSKETIPVDHIISWSYISE